jgi:hypothetical protein
LGMERSETDDSQPPLRARQANDLMLHGWIATGDI